MTILEKCGQIYVVRRCFFHCSQKGSFHTNTTGQRFHVKVVFISRETGPISSGNVLFDFSYRRASEFDSWRRTALEIRLPLETRKVTRGNTFSVPHLCSTNSHSEFQSLYIEIQFFSTQAVTPSYYHGTQGFIVAFDVTDKSSYDRILDWLLIIEQHASKRGSQKMLVANKCHCKERNRVITEKEGEALAREFGMRYVEINDLQGSDIDEALKQLIQDILNNNGAPGKVEDGHKTNICELDTEYNGTRTGGEKESLLG